jgi:hypothetical protein
MVKRLVLLPLLFALVLSFGSCTKIGPTFSPAGPVSFVKVMPVIPLDSGDLVAVTPHPIDGHWVALWFQKPDKTISVRWVNITLGTVGPEMTIPRK